MNWNLEGLYVKAKYMDYDCSGCVVMSRVKYGGGIQHTVVLDAPIQLPWRSHSTDRVLVEHKDVERVASTNQNF